MVRDHPWLAEPGPPHRSLACDSRVKRCYNSTETLPNTAHLSHIHGAFSVTAINPKIAAIACDHSIAADRRSMQRSLFRSAVRWRPRRGTGISRAKPGARCLFAANISEISQPSSSSRQLDMPRTAGYEHVTVVDLSRPACGHVKQALKGREF